MIPNTLHIGSSMFVFHIKDGTIHSLGAAPRQHRTGRTALGGITQVSAYAAKEPSFAHRSSSLHFLQVGYLSPSLFHLPQLSLF